MGKRKKKTMTLGEIGFAMKYEASKSEGDVIIVSKALWLEIAQLLMDTDDKLKAIEKEIDEQLKAGGNDGRCQMDKDHN